MSHDHPIAWLTVLAYALAAVLSFSASRAANDERQRGFWLGAALMLVLLGLNKQLDAQTLMVDLLRASAREHGWYAQRRLLQGLFLLALGTASAAAAIAVAALLRGTAAATRVGSAGMMLLLIYVLVRAASFHHLDVWARIDVGGLRSGWLLELAGIVVVAAAAKAFVARQPSTATRRGAR